MKYKFKDGGVVKLQNAWTTMPNPEDSIRRAWETQAQREREAAFTDSLGYITQGDSKKRNALTRWAQDTAKGQEAVRALNTLKWAADKGLMLAGGNWLLKGLKAKKYLTTAGELVGGAAGAEGLNQAGKWVDDKLGTSNPFLDFQKLGTLSGVILGASGAKKSLQWAAGKGVNLPASNMEFNNLRTQYLNNIAGKAKIQTPNKGWENYSNYDVYENAFKNKPSVDLSEPITMDEAKASASQWLGDRIQLGDPEILKGLQIAPSSTPETGYIDFYDTSKPMNKSLRKTFYAAPGGQGHSYGRPVIQGVMHRTVDGTEYLEYPRNSNIRYYLGKFKTEGKEPTLVHIGPPNMDGTVMKPRPDPLRRVDQDFLWWQRNNPFWSKGEITTRINDVVPSKSAIGNVNSDYPTRLTGPVDLADPKLNTVQMQYNPLTKTFGWMKYVVPKESGPTPQEAATTYHWDPRVKLLSRPISEAELEGTPKGERNQPVKKSIRSNSRYFLDAKELFPRDLSEIIPEDALVPNMYEQYKLSHKSNPHRGFDVYGWLEERPQDSEEIINKINDFTKSLPEYDIRFAREDKTPSFYVSQFRDYLSSLGYDTKDISDESILKLLTHQYKDLSNGAIGKLKGRLVFHGTDKPFESFDYHFTGKNTGNMGYNGAGNYFTTHPSPYGSKMVSTFFGKKHRVGFQQPYMITDIKSTPLNDGNLSSKLDIPSYISPHGGDYESVINAAIQKADRGIVKDMAIIDNISVYPPQLFTEEIPISEFSVARNTGIKSLFPHPSRFIRNADGTVSLTPTDWSDIRVNYKNGGIFNEKTQR